jgi:hypothetical protein
LILASKKVGGTVDASISNNEISVGAWIDVSILGSYFVGFTLSLSHGRTEAAGAASGIQPEGARLGFGLLNRALRHPLIGPDCGACQGW